MMAADLKQPWDEAYRASARSLAILRVLLGVVLLPRFQWIAGFPDEFFNPPPGPASLFSGFPPRSFFVGVDTVLITATVFLIAGRYVTVASTAITSALLTGNTWAFRAAAFRALCGLGCLFHVVVGHMMHITFVSNLRPTRRSPIGRIWQSARASSRRSSGCSDGCWGAGPGTSWQCRQP